MLFHFAEDWIYLVWFCLYLKGVCHLSRSVTDLLFLGHLSMKPWKSLGYWLWDRSLNGLTNGQDFDSVDEAGKELQVLGCSFQAFLSPSNCQADRQGTWNPILSNYPPMGLSVSLIDLFVFIICSDFNKFANTNQGKNIPVVCPNNCTVISQFE